jgi:MYXO-CTERM domain-containing protein
VNPRSLLASESIHVSFGGCGCAVGEGARPAPLFLLAAALLWWRRRRR